MILKDSYDDSDQKDYRAGDEVALTITQQTDLGFKALINDEQEGLLYHNEIFGELNIGDVKRGFIKTIRPDGKIDLSLQQPGYEHIEQNKYRILQQIKKNKGYIDVGDKSSPEEIYNRFSLSKKAFKKIIGALFKEKLIAIYDYEIRLVDKLGE